MKFAQNLAFLLAMLLPGVAWAVSPTVVELYQSQGCSSCPPAIRNVNAIADRSDILALTFAVTYWDGLGWKDTFARPEFTSRQYAYAHGLHHADVYTPQVVINGRADLTGTDRFELLAAMARTVTTKGPDISVSEDTVSVLASPTLPAADVWLVRYDSRVLSVRIGSGENGGISIAPRNVVRELVRLGGWAGTAQTYHVPPGGDQAWHSAILVQARMGGPILSARKL